MRRMRMWLLAIASLTIGLAVPVLAESGSPDDREALARELRGAWLPLESGMTLSRSKGTPISA